MLQGTKLQHLFLEMESEQQQKLGIGHFFLDGFGVIFCGSKNFGLDLLHTPGKEIIHLSGLKIGCVRGMLELSSELQTVFKKFSGKATFIHQIRRTEIAVFRILCLSGAPGIHQFDGSGKIRRHKVRMHGRKMAHQHVFEHMQSLWMKKIPALGII